MKPVLLPIEKIRIDGGTQPRVRFSVEHVCDIASAADRGKQIPPINVMQDSDGNLYLYDGYHRRDAAISRGQQEILAYVKQGSLGDAIQESLSVNADHGLKRTVDDKRRAVETCLKHDEWKKLSDHKIAEMCDVSQPFVGKVRREFEPVKSASPNPSSPKGDNVITPNPSSPKGDNVITPTPRSAAKQIRIDTPAAGAPTPKIVAMPDQVHPKSRFGMDLASSPDQTVKIHVSVDKTDPQNDAATDDPIGLDETHKVYAERKAEIAPAIAELEKWADWIQVARQEFHQVRDLATALKITIVGSVEESMKIAITQLESLIDAFDFVEAMNT